MVLLRVHWHSDIDAGSERQRGLTTPAWRSGRSPFRGCPGGPCRRKAREGGCEGRLLGDTIELTGGPRRCDASHKAVVPLDHARASIRHSGRVFVKFSMPLASAGFGG